MRLPPILGKCTPAAEKIIRAELKKILSTLTPKAEEVALMRWRQEEKKGKHWDDWNFEAKICGRIVPCIAQIRQGDIFYTDLSMHSEGIVEVDIAGVFGMYDHSPRFHESLRGGWGCYDLELFGTQADVRTYLKHRAVALQEEILEDISKIHSKTQDIFNTNKLLKDLTSQV